MMNGNMVSGEVKLKQAMKFGICPKLIQEIIPFFILIKLLKATSRLRRRVFGMLENLVVGRHDPSGFEDFFDGAK